MPLALLLALAASLGIHAAALLGPDVALFGGAPEESKPLRVELQPPPPPPMRPVTPAAAGRQPGPAKPRSRPAADTPRIVEKAPESPSTATEGPPHAGQSPLPDQPLPDQPPPVEATKPVLPASGTIRFAIYRGTRGFQIGRAEHHWEFTADGRYRLTGVSETSGLVALFKSVRFENESTGRLVAGGLRPDHYRARRNGWAGEEQADFDWPSPVAHLSGSGGRTVPVAPGTQDILSLNYQLAYVAHLEDGARIGVVTSRKYEAYALDPVGEEELVTPAGRFRTLHLSAQAGDRTEIWVALDSHRLPVKIRYTDKKGDIYEQVATEIGMP